MNPLQEKCKLVPDFCLQGMLPHWLADGPLPMRMMGATTYDSGGRCYFGLERVQALATKITCVKTGKVVVVVVVVVLAGRNAKYAAVRTTQN
jgi:hypothetical protein